MTTRTARLRVAGADLHYEIDGSGPLLALIPAGTADAGSYRNLADRLAPHYTVLRYDRRGYSRSSRDDPGSAVEVGTHSGDLVRLLGAVSDEPAYVFGSSAGAVIALDLAARFPAAAKRIVVHEPPLPQLVPDDEEPHNGMSRAGRDVGAQEAVRQFAARIGVDREHRDREPDLMPPLPNPWNQRNLEFFLAHEVPAVGRFRPDLAALRTTGNLVPAAGIASRTRWPYRCAAALAERLAVDLAEFPGDHGGFAAQPRAFASRLHEILTTPQTPGE